MQRGRRGENWTVVNYRGGRQRNYADPSADSSADNHHGRDDYRRSYASVTQRGMRKGDYPHRQMRDSGHVPQFFDRQIQAQSDIPNREASAKRTHTNKKQNNKNNKKIPKSMDPDFKQKVKVMHTIIKVAHHLHNVSAPEPPPAIARLAQNLASTIKPASPNNTTQMLIEGNAKNWAYTTLLILQDHYNAALEKEMDKLKILSPHDWHAPFEVAKSWAKRNLGHRLKEETLTQVEALLVVLLADLIPPETAEKENQPEIQEENTNINTPGKQQSNTVTVQVHKTPQKTARTQTPRKMPRRTVFTQTPKKRKTLTLPESTQTSPEPQVQRTPGKSVHTQTPKKKKKPVTSLDSIQTSPVIVLQRRNSLPQVKSTEREPIPPTHTPEAKRLSPQKAPPAEPAETSTCEGQFGKSLTDLLNAPQQTIRRALRAPRAKRGLDF